MWKKAQLCLLILFVLCFTHSVRSQTSGGRISATFTSVTAGAGISTLGTGIVSHQLIWNVSGTVSTCTVALDSSADNVTWSAGGVIAGQTCTSNGQSLVTSIIANYVRVNVTALSGAGATVNVTWVGNAAGSGTVTLSGNGAVSNGIFVDGTNDVIVANSTSNGVGFTVNELLTVRTQKPDGSILTQSQLSSITASANQQATSMIYIFPPKGQLILAAALPDVGSIGYGQMWMQLAILPCGVSLGLTPGATGTITAAQYNGCTGANTNMSIAQGGTSGFEPVCYGNGVSCPSAVPTNQGFNFSQNFSNPAAGAEIVATTALSTLNVRTCINSVTFKLVTSATAGNRFVFLHINTSSGSGAEIYGYQVPIPIPPSTTAFVYFSPGGGPPSSTFSASTMWITAPFYNGPMGMCFNGAVDSNVNVNTTTQNLSGTDQYSLMAERVTVWTEGN